MQHRHFFFMCTFFESSLCHWYRWGEEHDAKECTEADGMMGLAKQAESKEQARLRARHDLQILVLWISWSLMTVRLTKRTT